MIPARFSYYHLPLLLVSDDNQLTGARVSMTGPLRGYKPGTWWRPGLRTGRCSASEDSGRSI